MPVMDEFQQEREEIKNRSFKEKASYFWDYYKWHVIGGTLGVIIVVSLIYSFLTKKETGYYVAFINMAETWNSKEYKGEFEKLSGIDLSKEELFFDADMFLDFTKMDDATVQTTQKIMVYISANDLDAMLGDTPVMDRYAYNDVLMDLREFLTDEEYEKYEPYFYYMDRTLLEEAAENPNVTYPEDPSDPSTMKDPVPVAILLADCQKLREAYACADVQYVAFLVNSEHQDINHVFLDYIFTN